MAATSSARVLGLALVGALLVPADASQGPQAASQDAPRIVLESLDGKRTTRGVGAAPIASLSAQGAAFARFLSIPAAPAAAEGPALADYGAFELVGGDRLTAAVVGGDGDVLEVALRGGVTLELSIDVIRSVVFPGRIPDTTTESPVAGEDGDRLYLVARRGLDRAEGILDSFAGPELAFEDARLGARDFPWSRVAALFITPLDEEGPADDGEGEGTARGERVSVTLAGGGRLSGELVRILGPVQGLALVIGGAATVELPGAVVREVALDDGSFRFLTELTRAAEAPRSLFGDEIGFHWPTRVDRNCSGGTLKVAGETFDRGFGVHAPSALRFEGLAKDGWKELRLACGVDDSGAPRSDGAPAGTVRFRVLGDGKVLWESPVTRAGSRAIRPPAIAVAGVDELVLEVDPAGDFVLDRANWLRPMVVR